MAVEVRGQGDVYTVHTGSGRVEAIGDEYQKWNIHIFAILSNKLVDGTPVSSYRFGHREANCLITAVLDRTENERLAVLIKTRRDSLVLIVKSSSRSDHGALEGSVDVNFLNPTLIPASSVEQEESYICTMQRFVEMPSFGAQGGERA